MSQRRVLLDPISGSDHRIVHYTSVLGPVDGKVDVGGVDERMDGTTSAGDAADLLDLLLGGGGLYLGVDCDLQHTQKDGMNGEIECLSCLGTISGRTEREKGESHLLKVGLDVGDSLESSGVKLARDLVADLLPRNLQHCDVQSSKPSVKSSVKIIWWLWR